VQLAFWIETNPEHGSVRFPHFDDVVVAQRCAAFARDARVNALHDFAWTTKQSNYLLLRHLHGIGSIVSDSDFLVGNFKPMLSARSKRSVAEPVAACNNGKAKQDDRNCPVRMVYQKGFA
jgi:hypothetical protein